MEILIPREVTESLRLKPGQQLQALEYGGEIRLVRVPSLAEARGMLRGMDTTLVREPDREFGW
ncbi:MAG: AbrB/MazE/SpoVT family DNA-binding domain-containing protein [Janthinobacterium lividum]